MAVSAVPSGYACPSAQTPIYLLSKGGQPASAASPNSSLWLMTALGPCGSINAGSSYVVNEVTTAASAWALASFMSSGGNVGASCTNTTGLDNAFSTATAWRNPATGTSPGAGIPSTLAVPTSKLNTLANALASCTASAGGSACSPLFNAASGSSAPGNTLDAALNIARLPGDNVAAIYALAADNAVFSPALSAAPPDWMLHNTISGGGMDSPASVALTLQAMCGSRATSIPSRNFHRRRRTFPCGNHGLRNQPILWHGARCRRAMSGSPTSRPLRTAATAMLPS